MSDQYLIPPEVFINGERYLLKISNGPGTVDVSLHETDDVRMLHPIVSSSCVDEYPVIMKTLEFLAERMTPLAATKSRRQKISSLD